MKKITFTIFLLFIAFQSLFGFPKRYIEDVFTQYIVEKDIVYGANIDYTGTLVDLKLDVYKPDGDIVTKRPLIIMLHGGYFLFGDKQSDYVTTYCQNLAKKGYVCASINYRVGMSDNTMTQFANACVRTIQDAKAAVRFFRKFAVVYGIDPNNIYWGGYSAGAVATIQGSYCSDADLSPFYNVAQVGDLEGNSGNPGYSSSVKGVMAQAGCILNPMWIQPGEMPNALFHGTADALIPFTYGKALGLVDVFGSYYINYFSNLNGIASALHPYSGMTHWIPTVEPDQTEITNDIIYGMAQFVYSQLEAEYTLTRYLDYVFTDYNMTADVVYGSNKDYQGNTISLKMDVYTPAGDVITKRPLIILLHGGYFIRGDKQYDYIATYCQNLAKKGYVCASIDYRLGISDMTSLKQFGNACARAGQDARAAVRFFRKNASSYGIDPDNIFWGGYSAGALATIHSSYCSDDDMAFLYEPALVGDLEGNSGNPGYPSKVKGLISQAGCIIDPRWIQSGEMPNVLFHGTADGTVPYGHDLAMGLFPVYGSYYINARSTGVGIYSKLYSFTDMNHWIYPDEPEKSQTYNTIIEGIAKFAYSLDVDVTTLTPFNITQDGAKTGGIIGEDHGASITSRGVCWNTTGNPDITCLNTIDGNGTGTFSSNITGLNSSTKYYVKAYAKNSLTTNYGNEVSFTTDSKITISITGDGTVNPAPNTQNEIYIVNGSSISFNFIPNGCNNVASVIIDGVSYGTESSHTFTGVNSDHTIQVEFKDITVPTISVSVNPTTIWPPNRNMINISASVTATDNCPGVTYVLESISCNESLASNDIQNASIGTANLDFKLRADRLGTGTGRIYTIKYKATDATGNASYATATVTVPHDQRKIVEQEDLLMPVSNGKLLQGLYPNPSYNSVNISYAIPEEGLVKISIYDNLGNKVAVLPEGNTKVGIYNQVWDLRDNNGQRVSDGVYIIRITNGINIESYPLTIMK